MKNILYILAGLLLPLMAAGANPDDLYSQYKSGADILIGDLVVNKTTYPDAVLVTPADLTFGHFAKGGLYFIDDKSGKGVADLAAAPIGKFSPVATTSSPLIVIGRYKIGGRQTEIKVSEMRTRGDVAFMNVKLTATQAAGESSPVFNMFAKNGNDHNSTAIATSTSAPRTLTPEVRTIHSLTRNVERTSQHQRVSTAIDSTTTATRYGLYNHKMLFVSIARQHYVCRLRRLII